MNSIKLLIDRYDAILRKRNFINYVKLYPPLSQEEILNNFIKLNIEDDNLNDLYKWKNGFNPNKDINIRCQINLFGAFQSLDSLFKTWESHVSASIWDESFIPFISEGTGEYILFNNERGKKYGKLYLYSASLLILKPLSYYDSIATMIETDILGYEKNAIKYEPRDNWLEIDLDLYYKIAGKLNPDSEFWKLYG